MADGTSVTSRLTTTRGGAIALGVLFMIIALILLLVYVNRYRNSVEEDAAPAPVLVAKSLIPTGTQRHDHRPAGAVHDLDRPPGRAQGRRDHRPRVPPGSGRDRRHLSRAADDDGRVRSHHQRSGPDADHRRTARPRPARRRARDTSSATSSRVTGSTSTRTSPGLLKLIVPERVRHARPGSRRREREVVLRAPNSEQAATIALLSDSTQLWFILRPTSGAKKSPPTEVTLAEILRKNPTG